MATTKITNPDLFDLGSLNSALRLPSGTEAERPASPSTGEWRYNTDSNTIEFWDGIKWRTLSDEDIPPTPSEHFNTVLYTGTSATHAITGVGFQPDLVWIKDRSNAESHIWNDSSRGAGNDLSSNSNNAQANRPTGFTSFDSDGFTLGTDGGGVVNDSSRGPYVAWCWKLNGGTTSSNTDGTITSTVQANTKAGFSLVQYTGNNTAGATVGHGLNSTPEFIIFKNYGGVAGWKIFNNYLSTPATQTLELNDPTGQYSPGNLFNSTLPTSSVFSLGNYSDTNNSGATFIAYCFHSVSGYSKLGSYTGNGSSNIISTGFEPAFVMTKRTSGSGDWRVYDNKRGSSSARYPLYANLNNVEGGGLNEITFLTNGFVLGTATNVNDSGETYIYMAIGSDPSAAPVLADSFANKLYTGDGGTQSITGLGFSPSFVWLKDRSSAYSNVLVDIVRGRSKSILSDNTSGNLTSNAGNDFVSFDSDGFTVGPLQQVYTNVNADDFIAWNWKANPTPTINTDGTIQSVVSANQAAGFSIVNYTGNGSASQTVGHGLSSAPELIFAKANITSSWVVYSSTTGTDKFLELNQTNAETSSSNYWGTSSPSATTFGVAPSNSNNNSSGNFVFAYCFTSISGFSKIGTYTGSGSGNTQSINTGFAASWVMIKDYNVGGSWWIQDTARGGAISLKANSSDAESTTNYVTFTSTGFDVTGGLNDNASGSKFIYMALKENPTPVVPAGQMAYLVVAGGGGGGVGYLYSNASGGAGAGGLRTSFGSTSGGGASAESNLTLAAGTYTITIGAGGNGAGRYSTPPLIRQFNGNDSSITGNASITSTAGGYGGAGGQDGGTGDYSGAIGGSGGGGSGFGSGAAGTANQGFAGASSRGGGGGASAAGSGANGGDGLSVAITGSAVDYAGGGGAGGQGSGGGGSAGTGGGGQGGQNSGSTKTGTANTGGGGGGGQGGSGASGSGTGWYSGGAGGSGIVVLRMRTSDYSGTTTGSPTVTTKGEETILTYTGSGTYVHS